MGGLKGMFGPNPVQTGTNILGMGMEMAFKKQAMDLDMQQKQMQMNFEKQKFNLLNMLQQKQLKLDQDKLKFQQEQIKAEQTRLEGEKEERKGVAYGGRRSPQIKPLEAMAKKGFVQSGQSSFLNLLQPETQVTSEQIKSLITPEEKVAFLMNNKQSVPKELMLDLLGLSEEKFDPNKFVENIRAAKTPEEKIGVLEAMGLEPTEAKLKALGIIVEEPKTPDIKKKIENIIMLMGAMSLITGESPTKAGFLGIGKKKIAPQYKPLFESVIKSLTAELEGSLQYSPNDLKTDKEERADLEAQGTPKATIRKMFEEDYPNDPDRVNRIMAD